MNEGRRYPKDIIFFSNLTKRSSANNLCNFPALLNIYLCLHGLSYAGKLEWKCKNLIVFVVTALFMIINEANKVYALVYFLVHVRVSQMNRNGYILRIIIILEYILRVLFFFKKRKLNHIIHRMLKLYSGTAIQTSFKCIAMLILVLIINDISTIYTFFTSYLSLTSSHFLSYLDDSFINEYKRITEANPSIIFCLFIQIWNVLSPFIPIYFCCFCLILKETINGFKNKFQRVHNISFNILDQTCTEIINLTGDMNESFLHYSSCECV